MARTPWAERSARDVSIHAGVGRSFKRAGRGRWVYSMSGARRVGFRSEMNRGVSELHWAKLGTRRVSFALVDGGVFDAVVATVASGLRGPQWQDDSMRLLAGDELFEAAFGAPDVARAIYAKPPLR